MSEMHTGRSPHPTTITLPDTEVLRAHGWQIVSSNGPYCLVWGQQREVLMVWRDGGWFQVFEVSRDSRIAG